MHRRVVEPTLALEEIPYTVANNAIMHFSKRGVRVEVRPDADAPVVQTGEVDLVDPTGMSAKDEPVTARITEIARHEVGPYTPDHPDERGSRER